jgi:hypothetical protein
MKPLRQALRDYLAMRRALGYQLARAEKLLDQFLAYLEDLGETHVRTDTALAWATQPTGTERVGSEAAQRSAGICRTPVHDRSRD